MRSRLKILFLFGGLMFISAACSTSKKTLGAAASEVKKMEDPFVGTWDYVVRDTPDGDVKGTLIISKTTDTYAAMLSSDQGEADLNGFSIEDNAMSGTFDFQGYELTMKGTFNGKMLKGDIGVEYMSFPLEATKVEESTAMDQK